MVLISTGIAGAILQPLKIINTDGGAVLHMLSMQSPLLPDFSEHFGELYFSEVLPGKIKAWKLHRSQTQLFAVPWGKVKIVLFDGRPQSDTYRKVCVLNLGRPDNYMLLKIPPLIWHGFEAISDFPALICNCSDLPHNPEEYEKISYDDSNAPCAWPGRII